jgi:hypothetical protein
MVIGGAMARSLLVLGLSILSTGCVTVRPSGVEIREPEETSLLVPQEPNATTGNVIRTIKAGKGGILTVDEVTPRLRGWIGARFADIDERTAVSRGLTPFEGVLVKDVERGGPAEAAGLSSGDVVQRLGSEPATSAGWLRFHLDETPPDTTVTLHVKRRAAAGAPPSEAEIPVKLGSRSDDLRNVQSYSLRYLRDPRHLGIEVSELTPELRKRYFGSPEGPLLLVTDLTVKKPAHLGNVRELDLIERINGRPVLHLEELRAMLADLKGGEKLTFTVIRHGSSDAASVEAASDVQKKTTFKIPLIVSYEGEYRRSEFDLLLFLFGYEAWDEWRDDGQEVDVRRCHDVGFLLDLIEYESSYDHSTFSLLWFIRFRSHRS